MPSGRLRHVPLKEIVKKKKKQWGGQLGGNENILMKRDSRACVNRSEIRKTKGQEPRYEISRDARCVI